MQVHLGRQCLPQGRSSPHPRCSVPTRSSRTSRPSPVVAQAAQPQQGPPQGQPQQPAKPKQWVPPRDILKISPALLATGGLDPSKDGPQAKASFDAHLSGMFMPVNLDYPGLRILNIDPPVIAVEELLSEAECDAIMDAAQASGLMKQSGLGIGGYAVQDENVRTSSTLAATSEVLGKHPQLNAALGVMLARARALLRGPLPADGPGAFARPSAAGQFAFELPQVARYQPGQHFLTHEDAFPPPVVAQKGYQRRATLLCYLNECAEGGATRFDVLDIAVQPRKGSALLFFPSFINGVNDRRTLHTAQDAVSEKWVTQLWTSCGVATLAHNNGLPSYVRGVKGAKVPQQPKGRKRGVPPQRVNTKV
ncbi:hypothetical protein HYH03_011591 [Edaphochlamys debaryana]|uniref:Prolyl 4-hydroxylase alpha subunit domain-containing protein n=1 Tax=Edaphochlamys debaryana TaxID=47281 RepID=A0A835XTR5_9CHLO|nr:hypothetical protein HYH03_011591 [Edaphochlamys debaryana]|eukprot:KAG2489961.1 hypothetical protein HYH03_011591 [Edaphochlamys debaryana]